MIAWGLKKMAAFGRYDLVEVLGQGGFATVHRAHDPVLDRDLAIKVLHGYLSGDDQVAERFVREGRALARIRHPNLVQVYDAGIADSQTFLAMEFVDGKSLHAIAEGRQMPLAEAVRVIEQVAGAIDAVHATGLIHRDIKPANIIVEPSGRAVLLDLGIARDMENTALTATGLVIGTPGFLAPEQVDSSVFVGPRTDVYQLAATAYTLLAGKPPYEGDTAQVLYSVAHKPPPDLSVARPDLPYHAIEAVTRALAKDPAQRPETAGAFASALRGLSATEATIVSPPISTAAGEPTQAAPLPAAPATAVPSGAATVVAPASAVDIAATRVAPQAAVASGRGANIAAGTPPRSRARLFGTIGAIAAAVIGVAVVFALFSGGGDDEPARAEDDPTPPAVSRQGQQSGAFKIGEFVELEVPQAESTTFAFDYPESGVVTFVVDEDSVSGYFRVVDERGKAVGTARWVPEAGGMVEPVALPPGATYALEFAPDEGESGNLRVAMYEVPRAEPVAISPGGEAIDLSVDVPGAVALASFTATAGQRLSIVTESSTEGYHLGVRTQTDPPRLALPLSWVPEADYFVDVFEVEREGDYVVVVDPDGADLVRTSVRLVDVGEDQTGPLSFGASVDFSTSNAGENIHYTFSGKREQKVSVRLQEVEAGSNIVLQRASTNSNVESAWAAAPQGALLLADLPADGEYTITIDPYMARLESGRIGLFDISKRATAVIQVGGPPVTVATDAPGQGIALGFRAEGGELVTFHSLTDDDAYVTLIGPNGNKIVDRLYVGGKSKNEWPRELVAGEYVLMLEQYGMDAGTYTIELEKR